MKIWRLAFAMLAAFSLASCSSDDDDKDVTKEINMSVSAEPGVMYDLFDSMGEHPIECMRVMTEDEPGQWQNLYFSDIKGFTYERGHEYELRVKRTILANPPQDASNRTYELVRILADNSPLTDEIRFVPSSHSAFLFKNVLTESEMAHVQQSMPQGETLHYSLILCNVYKRGIQKVEFTIKTCLLADYQQLRPFLTIFSQINFAV